MKLQLILALAALVDNTRADESSRRDHPQTPGPSSRRDHPQTPHCDHIRDRRQRSQCRAAAPKKVACPRRRRHAVPRILAQTHGSPTLDGLPAPLKNASLSLRRENPSWQFVYFNDAAICAEIKFRGRSVLGRFDAVSTVDASSTRVEEGPREFFSSKQEPNQSRRG